MISAPLLILPFVLAHGVVPSASEVLAAAQTEAGKSNRKVLVYFHASWCPWCRKLDALLEAPGLKKAFDRSYVVARITVRERAEKKALENLGWEPVMLQYRHAAEQDVPYVVITDATGKKLAESYRGEQAKIPDNAGYPTTRVEIDRFITMIRATGRGFGAMERSYLENYLQASTVLKKKS